MKRMLASAAFAAMLSAPLVGTSALAGEHGSAAPRSGSKPLVSEPTEAKPSELKPSEPKPLEPYELMRTLERVQNEAAMGDAAAYAARPKLVASIATGFATADPHIWKDPRNVRAAAIYLLSGGQSPVVERLMALNAFPADSAKLMQGVLAYAEGRKPQAKEALLDIDARSLPDSLAAQLALVQSMLVADTDRARAIGLLDLARLLMPGTLVDDVALRREAFLAMQAGDARKFLFLSEQYVRRFRRSVYAEDFTRSFVASAAKLKLDVADGSFDRLADIIGLFRLDEQRRIFLSIAQASVLDGRIEMARFAAQHALAICPEGSVERARAALYQAAALILTDDHDKGRAILDSVPETRLPPSDAHLRQAVLAVAGQLRPSKDVAASAGGAPPDAEAVPASIPASKLASATISDAMKQMAEVDQLLRSAAP